MLPIKKVYIDSRFKTKDSKSNSEFKFELSQSIDLPDRCVCYIDDIIIPHSWYTIETGMNDKLYIRHATGGTFTEHVLIIPGQNYSGEGLKTAIQSVFNAAFANIYTVTYQERKGTIEIQCTSSHSFKIMSDEQVKSRGITWTGPPINMDDLHSINEVLRNDSPVSDIESFSTSYESGFLDVMNIHNIYISSPNLGSFSTLGPRGECNIVKKVPVTSNYGYAIFDNVVSQHDYIDVSRQALRTLEFKLSSARGVVVPLHGSHVSFSIIFSTLKEDM